MGRDISELFYLTGMLTTEQLCDCLISPIFNPLNILVSYFHVELKQLRTNTRLKRPQDNQALDQVWL